MNLKIFNVWDTSSVKVQDPGLREYITLSPRVAPKTGGRLTKIKFHKSKYNIVERLINKLMVPGHRSRKHFKTSGRCTGKSNTCYKIVLETFRLLEQKTNKNPVEVFVKALENACPREEITTIEYGGARYPQAVECAPQRRVDLALRFMVQGSYWKSFGKKPKMIEALADEIIKAYQLSNQSNAIAKKLELERQADASR